MQYWLEKGKRDDEKHKAAQFLVLRGKFPVVAPMIQAVDVFFEQR